MSPKPIPYQKPHPNNRFEQHVESEVKDEGNSRSCRSHICGKDLKSDSSEIWKIDEAKSASVPEVDAATRRTILHCQDGSPEVARLRSQSSSNVTARTHLSFAEHQTAPPNHLHSFFQTNSPDSIHDASTVSLSNMNSTNSMVPADQERQILMLMLLAQVCALHDPTPRTFVVHVLELFERGILDKQSINFLYDLGLVPQKPLVPLLLEGPQPPEMKYSEELAVLTRQTNSRTSFLLHQRSMEVSAIRSALAHHDHVHQLRRNHSDPEHFQSNHCTDSQIPQWSVEDFPLSLSRYQREFDPIALISSGSFGQVFRAICKLDGREYAIKRIPFAAAGYSSDTVQRVVREVHCLAKCDHPHVVRYNTAWLEPSWMTGTQSDHSMIRASNGSYPPSTSNLQHIQRSKLLTDFQHIITTGEGFENLSADLKEYFIDPNRSDKSSHRRRSSFNDASFDISAKNRSDFDEDVSEWTINKSKDDLFIDRVRCHKENNLFFDHDDEDDIFARSHTNEIPEPSKTRYACEETTQYRYQICLFIQMQLCHPATLAEWICTRNQKLKDKSIGDRIDSAVEIFFQIADGLSHVHANGIVHRDIKPSNIFASADGLNFKIGDFGLSKLIDGGTANTRHNNISPLNRKRQQLLIQDNATAKPDPGEACVTIRQDPLTSGVGTTSYAAPEQIASSNYGMTADIFSLGLILLELLCCFSTDHERLQTFQNCRHLRSLPNDFKDYNILAQTILTCTDPVAEKRPSAAYLKKACSDFAICRPHVKASECDLVASLKQQLAAKDQELAEYKDKLEMKNRIIQDLQRQQSTSRNSDGDNGRPFLSQIEIDASSWEQASLSGSSSEDGI